MAPSSPSPSLVEGSLTASASASAHLNDHGGAVLGPRVLDQAESSTATAPPVTDTRDTDTDTDTDADTDADTAPAPAPAPVPAGQAGQAVLDAGDLHRCFICLEDQTPGDDWTTPCKCSLEGHQRCMLSWVADLESRAKAVKCPLCQAKIEVLDRFDVAVYLSDTMMAYYSNMSPLVLVSLISTSTLLSSAFYGMHALEVFAGPGAVMRYVYKAPTEAESGFWDNFVPRLRESVPFLGLAGRDKDGFLGDDLGLEPRVDLVRFLSLSLVGPALVLNRIYFGNIVLIPTSLMYFVSLVGQPPEGPPAWPPSPQRVLALFPVCKAFYSHVYKMCAKQVANKALKASTPPRQGEVADAARVATHAQEAGAEGAIDEPIQPGVAAGIDVPDAQPDDPAPVARPPRADDALGCLINYFAGAFLWPTVSYGMGRLLQLALPKAWVNRSHSSPSTGLLQERWGRSLVGGCLFVVLKDAFFLYVEYRRALNRPYRSIRSINRRDRG